MHFEIVFDATTIIITLIFYLVCKKLRAPILKYGSIITLTLLMFVGIFCISLCSINLNNCLSFGLQQRLAFLPLLLVSLYIIYFWIILGIIFIINIIITTIVTKTTKILKN